MDVVYLLGVAALVAAVVGLVVGCDRLGARR